jgi:hypothetical protein
MSKASMKPEKSKTDVRNTNGAATRKSSDPGRDEIEKRAYFYWLEGGCEDGCHENDWFRAEHDVARDDSRN